MKNILSQTIKEINSMEDKYLILKITQQIAMFKLNYIPYAHYYMENISS